MDKTIYINFSDLSEDKQDEIMQIAMDEIYSNDDEFKEILETWGDRADEIIRERAERVLYSFNYIFNV